MNTLLQERLKKGFKKEDLELRGPTGEMEDSEHQTRRDPSKIDFMQLKRPSRVWLLKGMQ
jgi:hypothetical protein